MIKLDHIDKAIIEMLNRDARLPSTQIAEELGVASRTVHHRLQRLIDQQVIRPVAVVNPATFGFSLAVDIFCEIEAGYQEQAIDAILKMPEISYIAYSTGDQDLSLQALFRSSEDMHSFITHELHKVPGMRRTRTVLLPRILKDTYQWLPPDEAYEDTSEETGLS